MGSPTRRFVPLLGLLLAACVGAGDVPASPSSAGAPEPFHRLRDREVVYAGGGREEPAPDGVVEVKFGWFGPDDAADPEAGDQWTAASLAVEEANARGGYGGASFRLVPAWSADPWGTGVRQITRLAYEERVWAFAGSPDSSAAHLVEQVTAKARLPFVNPVSTDKSTNLAGVPWIFSCTPGDHVFAPALARALVERAGNGTITVVSGIDHDSRLTTRELLTALDAHGVSPSAHLELRPDTASFASLVDGVRRTDPAALALIAGPREGGRLLATLRANGLEVPVVGGPACGRRAFGEAAGAAAEGVVFPLLWDPAAGGVAATAFRRRFLARTGRAPDYAAAHAYDAVSLLIAATHRAGLNRPRLRDALRDLSPWTGVTGTIVWDPTGHNARPVRLGTIRGGIPALLGASPSR